jgi:hypothetical protein
MFATGDSVFWVNRLITRTYLRFDSRLIKFRAMLPRIGCLLFCVVMLIATDTTPAISSSTPQDVSMRDRFVGAWRLVSIETIRPNGEVIYPYYGKHPEGLLVYDRNGWMSVQIVSDPKPTVPRESTRESFLAAPAQQKVEAINGYYAYYGTWTVDRSSSTVTHHIQQSLYPGERGESGERHFSFDGDHLTLSAKAHEMGEDHQRKLVWQRAAAAQ